MEVKKKFFNRIGAFVCALVVLVGCLGGATNYYAVTDEEYYKSFDWENYFAMRPDVFINNNYVETYKELCANSVIDGYYNLFFIDSDGSKLYHVYSVNPVVIVREGNAIGFKFGYDCQLRIATPDNLMFENVSLSGHVGTFRNFCWCDTLGYIYTFGQSARYLFSDYDVLWSESGNVAFSSSIVGFDENLGYLQGLKREVLYKNGVLGTYIDDSRLDKWKYNNITTSGIDLSQGNYTIRHYIQPNLVDGYKLENIIEQYDKYLVGVYDASACSFSYLRTDVENIMAEQGFDGIGFTDAYLKGRFILEHHLFQLVSSDGEVGPILRVRANDEKGLLVEDYFDFDSNESDSFVTDGLLPDGSVDAEYEKDYVDSVTGSGSTYEDAEQQAQKPNIDITNMNGFSEFGGVVNEYTSEIGNVSNAMGSILLSLPDWVVTCLGISLCLTVVVIVIKALRG